MSSEHTRREHVTIEHESKIYTGSYTTADGMVHVSCGTGSKSTQIGQTPSVVLARLLIRQLVQEQQSEKACSYNSAREHQEPRES
jgi:hypothetical protein